MNLNTRGSPGLDDIACAYHSLVRLNLEVKEVGWRVVVGSGGSSSSSSSSSKEQEQEQEQEQGRRENKML